MITIGQACGATDAEWRSAMPPRSVLVRLIPQWFGTPYRESLSSYFMRLADAHGVSPQLLAREFFRGSMGSAPEGEDREWDSDDRWKLPSFNGIGIIPARWASAMEELTRFHGLKALTLLPFGERIVSRGLLARKPRWCPQCHRDTGTTGVPYAQLLWALADVAACPIHAVRLVDACSCGPEEALPAGRVRALPHICGKCGIDLARLDSDRIEAASPREVLRAKMVAEFLGDGSGGSLHGNARGISDFLEGSIRIHAEGNAARFGRLIRVGKASIHGWVHGSHRPNFRQIIDIAEAHGCSIGDVLNGDTEAMTKSPLIPESNRVIPPRPTRRKIRWEDVGSILEETLRQGDPRPLGKVAKSLDIDVRQLRNAHPELCARIAKRWRDYRESLISTQRSAKAVMVRDAARRIALNGMRPTWRRLQESFPDLGPCALRHDSRRCVEICREVSQEFDISEQPRKAVPDTEPGVNP